MASEGEQGSVSTATEGFQMVQEVTVKTSVTVSEVMVSQQNEEIKVSSLQESKPLPKEEEAEPNSSEIGSQVVEVSQVKSDSKIYIVSITEKNEQLKDNVITDDVKLELDVKPSVLDDGGKTEPVVVDEQDFKKNDILDDEKLNLDDDSMEEDALESKQIDMSDKTEVPPVDVIMVEDKNPESIQENADPAVLSTKRKQYDQENSEVIKRQRRWNSEKAPEQQNINSPSVSTTPKGMFQPSMKHSFSRSDSSISHEEPKERVVPPSSKPATTTSRRHPPSTTTTCRHTTTTPPPPSTTATPTPTSTATLPSSSTTINNTASPSTTTAPGETRTSDHDTG